MEQSRSVTGSAVAYVLTNTLVSIAAATISGSGWGRTTTASCSQDIARRCWSVKCRDADRDRNNERGQCQYCYDCDQA